jgi:hypothetical protein
MHAYIRIFALCSPYMALLELFDKEGPKPKAKSQSQQQQQQQMQQTITIKPAELFLRKD